jgi:hypothetical protein
VWAVGTLRHELTPSSSLSILTFLHSSPRQQWFADLLHYIRVDGYDIMHSEQVMKNNHGSCSCWGVLFYACIHPFLTKSLSPGTWYDSTVQGLALMSSNSTVAQNVARDVARYNGLRLASSAHVFPRRLA